MGWLEIESWYVRDFLVIASELRLSHSGGTESELLNIEARVKCLPSYVISTIECYDKEWKCQTTSSFLYFLVGILVNV
jgi:hypothetical protein